MITFILLFTFRVSNGQDWKIEKMLQGDSIGFASLRYSADEQGLAAIDTKGTLKWQIPVPGLILGMGRFHDNLLAFYTAEHKDQAFTEIKTIHAIVIGLKQKKIIADKVVFTNETKYYIDPIVTNDPAGNFNSLVIRNTGEKGGSTFFHTAIRNELMSGMVSVSAISIAEDLTAERRDLNSAAINGNFVSVCSGHQNDIYLTSFINGQLVVEQFNADRKAVSKLSLNVPYKNKSFFRTIASFDSFSVSSVDVAIKYENEKGKDVLNLFRFDFSAQKAFATPDVVLNKDYENQLKDAQAEKVRSSNLKRIDNLHPVQILETNDRIIVLKEIQYVYSFVQKDAAQRYSRDAGIISIYTKDLHTFKEIVIDKTCETFIGGANSIGGHIKDGKLYIVTLEVAGIGGYKDGIYTINTSDGSINKNVMDRVGASRTLVLDPTSIFWFPNNFITPLVFAKAIFRITYTTTLRSKPYP